MGQYDNAKIPRRCKVFQDGGVFYVYDEHDVGNLIATREAPFPVPAFDTKMATRARDWFTAEARTSVVSWGKFED